MNGFDQIVGQPTAVELLGKMLDANRVPHALLFRGPEGVGKATAAAGFAAALICEADGRDPCGDCGSCALIRTNSHPDFLRVGRLTRREIDKKERSRLCTENPDAGEGDLGSQILVDQIRSLNAIVGLRPRQGRRRVFVVDPADRMNREAQNSLLKTLEEPPARSVLILVSSRPHLLLPTVRSRCFAVGFSSMRVAEVSRLLEQRGMASAEAGARAALSGGSLGQALALDLDARLERRREVLEMIESLASDRPAVRELPAMAASLAGKDEATILDGLDLVQGLLRDAARAGTSGGAASLLHVDLADHVGRLGAKIGPVRAATLVTCIERLRGDLRFNTNRVLIAEALLAALAGGPIP